MNESTIATMFSSARTGTGSDTWATPQDLFEELNREFGFVLDAAASFENKKTTLFYSNALEQDWYADVPRFMGQPVGAVWLNPPYSQQDKFLAKVVSEVAKGLTVVCLLPARTGTKRWHKYIWDKTKHQPRPGVEVRFLDKRVTFEGATGPAPFDSCVVVFRPPPPPMVGCRTSPHGEYDYCPVCDGGRR